MDNCFKGTGLLLFTCETISTGCTAGFEDLSLVMKRGSCTSGRGVSLSVRCSKLNTVRSVPPRVADGPWWHVGVRDHRDGLPEKGVCLGVGGNTFQSEGEWRPLRLHCTRPHNSDLLGPLCRMWEVGVRWEPGAQRRSYIRHLEQLAASGLFAGSCSMFGCRSFAPYNGRC